MKTILIFLLCAWGLYCIMTSVLPHVYPPAAAALRKRSPKKITKTEVLLERLTACIAAHIHLEPLKRTTLADELQSLGYEITPERFLADAVTKALLYTGSALFISFLLFSPLLALVIGATVGGLVYTQSGKKLRKEMDAKRSSIERELPQFASTIHQALRSTHDVISIFESYRKICGTTLRDEIDRTLNDMKTGNPERALKSFESRIASAELSQLTRGLIGVLRGDDRRVYFEMLAMEYQKAAGEAVSKELQLRPQKLYPFFGALFACLVLIIGIALGLNIMQQMHAFF